MPLDAPLFSIVTPVFRTPLDYLEACIASVEAQTFEDWELLLVDDGNENDLAAWLDKRASVDPRLRIIHAPNNLGISRASQLGVVAAKGEFIALLDHDDLLSPIALSRMAEEITVKPHADYLYSDEDKTDGDGQYVLPFFKPDWSPERFRHQMYTSHLSVLRTSLVHQVGGFREGFEGSQDYDLVLRVTENARSIVHIREILYHWRAHKDSTAETADQKPFAKIAARRAIEEHCTRLGIDAEVEYGPEAGVYRVKRRVAGEPLVSFLLPIYGKSAEVWGQTVPLVLHFIDNVEQMTTYRNFEYVITYDSKMAPELLAEIERRCTRPVKLIEYVEPPEGFNFATKVNMAAIRSSGEYLIVLNDDLQVITANWVEELIGLAQDPSVGAVGGMYYFDDDTIQHAGVTCSAGAYHLFYHFPRGKSVYGNHLAVVRESSVLTAACLAVSRATFFRVGGFTEDLPNNFNDVDFCLKLRSCGLRNIWTPYVEMYHFESKTRVNTVRPFENDTLEGRWGRRLYIDPYYNPNLQAAWPTWRPFDDWDLATRGWPVPVGDLSKLDMPRYLEMNPDLAEELARNPEWSIIEHFISHGCHERRLQSTTRERHERDRNRARRVPARAVGFDREGYLRANADLYALALENPEWDPYEHLLSYGIYEGRYMYVARDAPHEAEVADAEQLTGYPERLLLEESTP